MPQTLNQLKIALLQLNSGNDIAQNVLTVEKFVREAVAGGAEFIITPESTCHMRFPLLKALETAQSEDDHIMINLLSSLANELNVMILAGSLLIKLNDENKVANRSYLFDNQGKIVTTYDKIHLFDVNLSDKQSYMESDLVRAGNREVLADTPWGGLGLTICYDLRFPGQFRNLAKAGANMIAVPAAFTVPTGKAHWEVLLRARAIENGCFIFACGQTGEHERNLSTYGHSMVVNPWGEIIAKTGKSPEILYADIDLSEVERIRHKIPSLQHG